MTLGPNTGRNHDFLITISDFAGALPPHTPTPCVKCEECSVTCGVSSAAFGTVHHFSAEHARTGLAGGGMWNAILRFSKHRTPTETLLWQPNDSRASLVQRQAACPRRHPVSPSVGQPKDFKASIVNARQPIPNSSPTSKTSLVLRILWQSLCQSAPCSNGTA